MWINCSLSSRTDVITEQNARLEVLQLAEITEKKYGIKKDLATYCFESLAYGLALINNVNDITRESSCESINVIGHWDFYYREGSKMQITIKPDGTAITSLNNKYLWKSEADNEIILYIKGMVSYRGCISGDTIEGQAYSEQFGRCWPWHATRRDDGLSKENLIQGKWLLKNEIEDLDDNIIEFDSDNGLISSVYDDGSWELDGGVLKITTANGFLLYEGRFSKGVISGEARNLIGDNWKFTLTKK